MSTIIETPASPTPATDGGTVGVAAQAAPTALQQARGTEYPAPGSDPKVVAAWVEREWKEGEAEALLRYRQGIRNILYANNRQWIAWSRRQQGYDDIPLDEKEIRVTMNEIVPILRSRAQRLLPGEVSWRAIPDSNAYEARDRAQVATHFIRARYEQQRMAGKLSTALDLAFCTGVMALKSFWNQNIGPMQTATIQQVDPATGQVMEAPVDAQMRPVADPAQAFQYRSGDTDTALRTVFNIRLNPEAHGWTEAEGLRSLIDSEVVPISVAREKYPAIASQIAPVAQGGETLLTYERIAAGSATARVGPTAGPTAAIAQARPSTTASNQLTVIRERWELPSKFFPDGRCTVTVGGAVAYDGPFPHGVFPYAPVFDEPAKLSPYGRPSVNDMIAPQDVINREWTAIVREMWLSGGGQFVAWDIPGIPSQMTVETGAVIKIPMRANTMGKGIADVFQRLPAPQVAGDRWRMIEQAKMTLYNIGAFHEVSRGQIPPGLDSGVAIEQLLESESGQLKNAADALKQTLILWARQQLAIAKWGYGADESRWMPVDRPDLGVMIESVTGAQLPDPDTVGLAIDYFRPTSEAARRAEVKELMTNGFIDPRRGLQLLDLGRGLDGAYESETRHYARARRENLAVQSGQFVLALDPTLGGPALWHPEDGSPFLLPIDDHAIHYDTHLEVALDDTQPWPVREAMLHHAMQHQMIVAQMQAQQMAAAAQAQGGPGGSGGDEPDGDDSGGGSSGSE